MRRLTLALVLLAACKTGGSAVRDEAPAAPDMRVEDFYPLRVGHRWTWEVRAPGQVGRQTVEIVREEKGWFIDSMGGRLKMDDLGLRDQDRYLLRGPLVEGTHWSNVESVQSIERHEIIDAGSSCSTRAGTWARCVVVRSTNAITPTRTFVLESTYAEGVGLVGQRTLQEEKGKTPAVVLQRELIAFEPAA